MPELRFAYRRKLRPAGRVGHPQANRGGMLTASSPAVNGINAAPRRRFRARLGAEPRMPVRREVAHTKNPALLLR